MADGINITSESLSSLLSSFKGEMEKMQTLMADIKSSTDNAKSIWEGTTSDAVLGQIENFQKVFEPIEEQNKKYVEFINTTIEAYENEDNAQINTVESNASSYGEISS
jgi:uncharacterized protein YukE